MPATRVAYPEMGSPDPLADSLMEEYASQPSPRKGQRARKSSDITISSSEVVVDQNASPWRIKVTVQAEHEGDPDTGAGRGKTITRTMKVPLRDHSSPTKSPRKPGRPAKMQNNDAPPSSPRKTRSRRKSVTDLDAVVLGDDAEEDEWTGKRVSPRKKNYNNNKAKSNTKAVATRRSVSDSFDVREDDGSVEHSERDDFTPEMREIDVNQIALRTRPTSISQTAIKDHTHGTDVRKVSINSAMSYPTPSPTASEFGHSDDHQQHNSNENENEIGLDTVMESEGFTMIDLDSLPSVRQMKNTPEYPTIQEEIEDSIDSAQTSRRNPTAVGAPSMCLSTLPEEDSTDLTHDIQSSPPTLDNGSKKKPYSIGHLQLPSSTNVYRHRHVTPMPLISPSLPSPPRAPASAVKERTPANSDKAVKAAIVLQDTVTPEHSLLGDHEHHDNASEKKNDTIFGGFSSSTQRQLRAELRFGEELGKKQNLREEQVWDQNVEVQQVAHAHQRPQVWRGETTVQHTPPINLATKAMNSVSATEVQLRSTSESPKNAVTGHENESRWEARARREREKVIEQAKATKEEEVVVIESDGADEDEGSEGKEDDVDETIGDIWLAEARNHSSSPRETVEKQNKKQSNEQSRRRLIPSPWKRGEQIDASDTSQAVCEESFTGLFPRNSEGSRMGGFGAAIIANPDKILQRGTHFDRRRSGEFVEGGKISRQPHRLSPRNEDGKGQDSIDDELDQGQNGLEWRNASDVVEEETSTLEAANRLSATDDHNVDGFAGATTHLYETNLEGISEQDLSSSPHIQLSKEQQDGLTEHDSTYSSLSEETTDDLYRQRTSLSPSKERPNTPRSALKGGRASFATALTFNNNNQQGTDRKVVWARRMSCMNEEWEESSRSIHSTQESFQDDTPTPLTIEKPLSQAREQRQTETSFLVDPQPPSQGQPSSGWFSWFKSNENFQSKNEEPQPVRLNSGKVANLDGSIDEFIKDDHNLDHEESSYAPTSRHTSVEVAPIQTRAQTQPLSLSAAYTTLRNQEDTQKPSRTSSTKNRCPQPQTKLPSYLKPPSYPSDPTRDPDTPLPTSGPFTKTHFRTLHIIYKKSLSPRFHGPAYPDEIRPKVLGLVEENWTLKVDESEAMDEMFEFQIGVPEARTLERFMREVEQGYLEKGSEVECVWRWSVKELAGWLGRIAVGEVVRGEEREARRILGGKKEKGKGDVKIELE